MTASAAVGASRWFGEADADVGSDQIIPILTGKTRPLGGLGFYREALVINLMVSIQPT